MAPRVEGEERGAAAGLRARPASRRRTVGLIEAHGTGTPVGDAAEVEALTRVFGERDGRAAALRARVRQVDDRPHDAGGGRRGLIKVALALHHRVLPPTLHCDEPNPKLALETRRST